MKPFKSCLIIRWLFHAGLFAGNRTPVGSISFLSARPSASLIRRSRIRPLDRFISSSVPEPRWQQTLFVGHRVDPFGSSHATLACAIPQCLCVETCWACDARISVFKQSKNTSPEHVYIVKTAACSPLEMRDSPRDDAPHMLARVSMTPHASRYFGHR